MDSVPDSFSEPHKWEQAGRAKRWQPLSPVNLTPFWLLQIGTAIALFWLIRELLKFVMAFTNQLLVKLPYLEPFQPFYRDPTQFVLITLGILLTLLPWLLDGLLRLFYGLQPLSMTTLSTQSPEATRVLERYCRKRRWPYPVLGILPTLAPVALTYGNLPRTARIVVSQGLLEQLADDEIATIYAGCLGHVAHWDFVVISLFILVTQLPYTVYRQVSQWGDQIEGKRQKYSQSVPGNKGKKHLCFYLFTFYLLLAGLSATFAYAVWCLLSGPALWLSQLRIYYSDRLAADITGNPNGLTRALLKIAQGIAVDIRQQGHTSWLLESLNILTSVGYLQAITLGSLHSPIQLEPVLAGDYLNPYRHWLSINNTHPLMGERLQRLTQIAHHWHLETELNLVKSQESASSTHASRTPLPSTGGTRRALAPLLRKRYPAFLLQGAPYFGIALGFALGGLTWLLGAIGIFLGITQLAWMYGDWWIIKGCLPIGFSIGTLIRINSFFPDIKPSTAQPSTAWLTNLSLLTNPDALPVFCQPVHLQGKLLGRRGISNWLGQDLILHSPTGLIKLHHVSCLWPFDNLLPRLPCPYDLIGRQVVATGWFRRGATPWMDIETLRTQFGKTSRSDHPVCSTLLAIAAAIWGTYIILLGGA